MAELHVIAPTTIPDTQKLRVGAYVRVSTDSEDQENSFLTQYDFYSQFIQSKSEWEFVDMYAESNPAFHYTSSTLFFVLRHPYTSCGICIY